MQENYNNNESVLSGKLVLVRSQTAGAFIGYVKNKIKREVHLTDCHYVWDWEGTNGLIELSLSTTNIKTNCKFSSRVPELFLLDVTEIIILNEQCTKLFEQEFI